MYTLLMAIIFALVVLITNKFEKFINFNQLKFDKKIGNINPFQIKSSNLLGKNPLSMDYLAKIIEKKRIGSLLNQLNIEDTVESTCMLRILYYKNAKYHNSIVNKCIKEFKERVNLTLKPLLSKYEVNKIITSFEEEKILLQIKYQDIQNSLLESGNGLKVNKSDYVKFFSLATGKPLIESQLLIDKFYDNVSDLEVNNIFTECISNTDSMNLFGNKHRSEIILNTHKNLRVVPPDRLNDLKNRTPWWSKFKFLNFW